MRAERCEGGRPLVARAQTAMSGSVSSSAASAPSTMAWSSAMATWILLIVRTAAAAGMSTLRRVPPAGVDLEPAAERLDALAHAAKSVAFAS